MPATSATRVLLAHPAKEAVAVDGLIARYNRDTVRFDLLGIESDRDLEGKMTEVRRILEDAVGILFFSRDLERAKTHLQWLERISLASTRKLPRVFVHFAGIKKKAEEIALKNQLLYRLPDLSVTNRWPRLTFLLLDGLAAIISKTNRVSVQRAKTLLTARKTRRKRSVPT